MKKTFLKCYNYFSEIPLEAIMWIATLVYLLFVNPYETQHFTLCLFSNLGIDFCPGCGIGRSIAMIYHGDFIRSFETHPLGLFALIIILLRIYNLLRNKNNHQQQTKGIKWQT